MSLELVLQPNADAGRDSVITNLAGADVNQGDDETLQLGSVQIGKMSQAFRALLRFDLGAIPQGSSIVDATLTLARNTGDSYVSDPTLHAYRLTRGDWTELGATWNQYDGMHAWTNPGGDYSTGDADAVTISSHEEDVVFDALAALAADAVENRGGELHLLVMGPETGGMNFVSTHSSDAADPDNWPKLVVHYELPVPALGIADHADNTGATATISGTGGESQNSVFVQRFDGNLGAGAWTEAGTRSGNGELTLALAAGHWFAYVRSELGGGQVVSPIVYFVVTDGLESIHVRCLAAVQARIRLLALDGLENDNVLIEKLPTGRHLGEAGLPAVVLSPQRAAMPAAEGTNGLDDVHYDVLVAIFDRDNQEPTLAAGLDRHLLWRQQIARAFRNQRLAGVPEVINSAVEPAEGVLEEAWQRELLSSAVVLRFTSRETRGFN